MTDHPAKPRRAQTGTSRDLAGIAARRVRSDAVPVTFDDELTGQHEGEELRRMRAKRPTDQRLQRLEDKHDELRDIVTRIEVTHGEMNGKLDTIVDMAGAEAVARTARAEAEAAERERRRTHIVPIIKAIGVAIAMIMAAILGREVLK